MKSKAYWINRAIDRQSTIDRLSQAELDEIRKIYDAAQRDLTRMINEIYETYSRKTGIDVSELKKLLSYSETDKFWKSLDGKNMKQYVMNNYKSRITRLEQIQAKLQEKCNNLASKQERAMRIAGKNAIRSSFSKTVYDTSIGINADLGFITLDDRTINTILKEKWLGSNYSERVWKNTDLLAKNVQSILTRTVMSGASQSRAIMELRDRMSVEWYKAERLVRTEMNHFHNQAELEAYEEMGVEKYVYVATLDNRTSEICQELDGKIFKLSEAQEGVNYPPMHPFCRSTVRAFISEEVEKSLKRRARDEEGNNEVIQNMSYKEWLDRKSSSDNDNENVLTKVEGSKVLNPMNEEQYHRMVSALSNQGVRVFPATEEDARYLHSLNAEAIYEQKVINHLGEIPSASAMFEEVIHYAQAMKYGELDSTDFVERTAREIAANRKLNTNGSAYGFTQEDIEEIARNLEMWENKYVELTGIAYDESGVDRSV